MRVLILLLVLLSVPVHARETVRIGGTGSGLELMHRLGSLYALQHPGLTISMVPSMGSSGGIKALQAGALDLAISARPVKPEEKGVKSIHLCRTPLVFAVNPVTSVSNIGADDLVQLYGNASQTWSDGGRVRVVLRPEAETTTKMLRGISPAIDQALSLAKARPGMIVAITDQDNLKVIQKTPGAFGLTTLAMVTAEQAKVRLVSYNGVEPTLQALMQGRYPLVRDYYLVVRTPVSDTAQKIINFARSTKGASLIKTLNCVPEEQR